MSFFNTITQLSKIFIKISFRLIGFEVSYYHKNPLHDFDEIYKNYSLDIKSLIIFDVGANTGQSIKRFLSFLNKPFIHSFEPLNDEFKILSSKYKNNYNVILNNYALSNQSEDTKIFYSNHFSQTSSFKKPVSNHNNFSIKEKIKVKCVTIDNYVNTNDIKKINILKIDTQGHEINVLEGAKETLEKQIIDFIEVEIIKGNAYEKSNNSFSDLENKLIPYGYKFYAINTSGSLYKSYDMLAFDLIYIKNSLIDKMNKIRNQNIKFSQKINND